jgi:AraC family transcriptional regulator
MQAGLFEIAENTYAANLAQSRHAHDDSSITLVLAGSLEETVTRAHEYAHALSLVVKPLDTEHQNRFGNAGARTLQIRIAADAHQDDLKALGHWRWQHGGMAARQALRVLQCFRSRLASDAEIAVYDLIAALRAEPLMTGAPPQWLLQVRDHIDALVPASVRVRDVAHAAAVHPVYLARQFRRYLGCSVVEYIAGRRMQHAAQLLSSSEVGLSGVAFKAGYADQSHLTRAFKAGTGLTPRGYRQAVAG